MINKIQRKWWSIQRWVYKNPETVWMIMFTPLFIVGIIGIAMQGTR